jgi:hypothetical protein
MYVHLIVCLRVGVYVRMDVGMYAFVCMCVYKCV